MGQVPGRRPVVVVAFAGAAGTASAFIAARGGGCVTVQPAVSIDFSKPV